VKVEVVLGHLQPEICATRRARSAASLPSARSAPVVWPKKWETCMQHTLHTSDREVEAEQ